MTFLSLSFSSHKQESNSAEVLFQMKNLVDEIESSFRVANNIDNILLLRCVLLEAENRYLKRDICEKNLKLNNLFSRNNLKVPLSSENVASGLEKEGEPEHEMKDELKESREGQGEREKNEAEKLQETIDDLHEELKEREKTIELLCEKYLHLKNNKNRMEIDLKKKICSLENLLNVTYGLLQESQKEFETKTEKYLSKTKNVYEALFLQEKWRCSKLMYENVRLHHEMKRLEEDGKKYCDVTNRSVDKCTSEPLMRFL